MTPDAPSLIGHVEAEHTLFHAWQAGRLHHAWLLTGPAGIGKATLAHRFATAVINGPKPGNRSSSKGAHPDLLVITCPTDEARSGPRRTDIVLDDVRPISGFLHRTATVGGWRVVIVESVDRMNQHAANTMLKLIEEPPSQVLLLLISDAPGRLLPTFRSRCRRLRLSPLDREAMDVVLQQQLPDATLAERQQLIALSSGSPGRALALAADVGVALSTLVQEALAHGNQGLELWCYNLADAVLRHESGFSTFLDLLCVALSGIIRAHAQGTHNSGNAALIGGTDLQHWAQTYSELTQLRDEAERFNLDKRQALVIGLSLLSGS